MSFSSYFCTLDVCTSSNRAVSETSPHRRLWTDPSPMLLGLELINTYSRFNFGDVVFLGQLLL